MTIACRRWLDWDAESGYLMFICLATATRSFEAGIVSSMMPSIQASLGLSYTQEGFLASAPDYGMIPGALLAGHIFQWASPHHVMQLGYIYVAICTVVFSLRVSYAGLVLTRATCSFWWSLSVVHFPAWINSHGNAEKKTRMLALPSLMLLLGTVLGYGVGGFANARGAAPWSSLYGLGGVLMLLCAVIGFTCLDAALVDDVDKSLDVVCVDRASAGGAAEETLTLTGNQRQSCLFLPAKAVELLCCRLFLLVLLMGSCVSGAGGFILYFIAQVGPLVTGWDMMTFSMVIAIGMVPSTIGGTLGGAECLSRIGGYQNYNGALLICVVCSVCCLLSTLMVPLGISISCPPVFIVGTFLIILFAAVPTTAINGLVVSIIPGAAHYASGMLFAALHLSKLIVPSVGGAVIDSLGLVPGFITVLVSLAVIMATTSSFAYVEYTMFHSQPGHVNT
eukprot:TRINITY_DN37880_c0_g1_i1.p1 TRINITY_DN37880_c0_g1~~TRINITY_DN37880_c0_g1_i1.p1  ORF type:complete len:450 (-),score=68.52 TRINITY_DN37880_c0_g1_i1:35-1384(-)